jgi:hypothetical protein
MKKLLIVLIVLIALAFVKWWLPIVALFLLFMYCLAKISAESNDDCMTDEYYNPPPKKSVKDESLRC